MKALIALDGTRLDAQLDRARQILPPESEWMLVHVIDTRPSEEVEAVLHGLPGRGPGRRRAEQRIEAAQRWDEQTMRAALEAWLARAGRPAEVLISRGRPEREIVRLVVAEAIDLCLIGRGHEGGPGRGPRHPPPPPPPHGRSPAEASPPPPPPRAPLGPVARFVVDHAPCDLLLLATAD